MKLVCDKKSKKLVGDFAKPLFKICIRLCFPLPNEIECLTLGLTVTISSFLRWADMRFVKNSTPPGYQAKNFTPLISLNFNSFGDNNEKNERKWRNLHRWQKFYTAAGTDGTDKFHLCFTICNVYTVYSIQTVLHYLNSIMYAYIYCYEVRGLLEYGSMSFWAKCWSGLDV